MPALKPTRPATRQRQIAPVNGEEIDAFTVRQIAATAQRAADQIRDRATLTMDLIVGDNVINHGLGRTPAGLTITPSVANATWAWAMKSPTTTQVTITCVGVAQPGASIEVYG
jgi:hypothetical protein